MPYKSLHFPSRRLTSFPLAKLRILASKLIWKLGLSGWCGDVWRCVSVWTSRPYISREHERHERKMLGAVSPGLLFASYNAGMRFIFLFYSSTLKLKRCWIDECGNLPFNPTLVLVEGATDHNTILLRNKFWRQHKLTFANGSELAAAVIR